MIGDRQGLFGVHPDREMIRRFRRRNVRGAIGLAVLFVVFLFRMIAQQ